MAWCLINYAQGQLYYLSNTIDSAKYNNFKINNGQLSQRFRGLYTYIHTLNVSILEYFLLDGPQIFNVMRVRRMYIFG
jgi:hypothetical protein